MKTRMEQMAGNALRYLCKKIQHYRNSGWTDKNNAVKVAIARHDKILKRWPKAYQVG